MTVNRDTTTGQFTAAEPTAADPPNTEPTTATRARLERAHRARQFTAEDVAKLRGGGKVPPAAAGQRAGRPCAS